jgi:hypothetical protein
VIESQAAGEPQVSLSLVGRGAQTPAGRWPVAWTIQNASAELVQIEEAWVPHGRFRAERERYDPPLQLAPRESARLDFEVAFDEEPGIEVENAFVIVRVLWQREAWRIFARLTVRAEDDGAPQPRVELISSQHVEFSG